MKTADIAMLLAYAAIIVLSFSLFGKVKSDYVTISYEDTHYTYPLDKDATYEIQGELGVTTVEIKDGEFRFVSSPCQGKTCIYQGFSEMIVCLPNKIIAATGEGELDAVSR